MAAARLFSLVVIAIIAAVLFSLFFLFDTDDRWSKDEPFDYGEPTPLDASDSMRVAVCQIRAELEALPAPIVAEHVFHSAWTERRFAAGSFDYGNAWELRLSEPAMSFVLQHSRVELIAALAPLLLDEKRGGRAAAILGGLPARSKAALHNTSAMAEAVVNAQGRDPAAPINWKVPGDNGKPYEPHIPIALYGLTNIGGRLERAAPRVFRGSFEARLGQLLEARSRLPMRTVRLEKQPGQPRKTFSELLESHPAPVIDQRFAEFLATFSREDILIAVFPMLGKGGQASGGPLVELIWATESQDRFWPLVQGSPLIEGSPYKVFLNEVAAELIGLCEQDAALVPPALKPYKSSD